MPYIAYHTIVYERLMAAFKVKGNIGFLMYISDAFGYLGSVVVMLIHDFSSIKTAQINYLNFFQGAIYVLGAVICIAVILSLFYFQYQYRTQMLEEN